MHIYRICVSNRPCQHQYMCAPVMIRACADAIVWVTVNMMFSTIRLVLMHKHCVLAGADGLHTGGMRIRTLSHKIFLLSFQSYYFLTCHPGHRSVSLTVGFLLRTSSSIACSSSGPHVGTFTDISNDQYHFSRVIGILIRSHGRQHEWAVSEEKSTPS